ncbi:MAG: MFS transporter, partial [Thermoplasmata archaeon]
MPASAPEPLLTAAGTPYDPHAARAVIIVLAVMALMVTYVETMVLPAFKQFIQFFGNPPTTTVVWIVSAYLLVGTVGTPIFGKLGDKYGKKRMLLIVMSLYAAAVSVAGFIPNIGSALGVSTANQIYLLIGVRAFQGLGMGMFPLAFAMMPEVFPARRVGQAQGIVSGMFAAGASLGLAGGGYIAWQFGWQLTFHTVTPVAILVVVLAYVYLRESPHLSPMAIDLPGIGSLGFALAMAMFGLTEGTYWGWTGFSAVSVAGIPWGVPEFFLLALASLAFFLYWEPRAPTPVVSFKSLKERNIWISNVNGVIVGVGMFLIFVALTILVEDPFPPGFNYNEFQLGLMALPSTFSMLAFAPLWGRWVSAKGPKPLMLAGFAVMGLGALGLVLFHATILDLIVFTIPTMVGNVAVLIAMSNIIVLSVNPKELGIQTGMNQTFRNLGSAVGP